jgi:hypothetical protein
MVAVENGEFQRAQALGPERVKPQNVAVPAAVVRLVQILQRLVAFELADDAIGVEGNEQPPRDIGPSLEFRGGQAESLGELGPAVPGAGVRVPRQRGAAARRTSRRQLPSHR